MKIRHPALIRLLSGATAGLIRPWIASLRPRIDTRLCGDHPADPREQRYIYVFWHEYLLAAMHFRSTPVHILISHHADGELIAQACHRLGVGVVRGSSRHGGTAALMELHRVSRETHLAVTPDGPRGPRRVLQPGVVRLASQIGLPIVPMGVGFRRCWRASSWDRFAAPMPFTAMHIVGGEPTVVPPQLKADKTEHYRQLVERRLNDATEDAERWSQGHPRSYDTPADVAAPAA